MFAQQRKYETGSGEYVPGSPLSRELFSLQLFTVNEVISAGGARRLQNDQDRGSELKNFA